MPKPFDSHSAAPRKSAWVLTEKAWHRFLTWLDGSKFEGNGYVEIQRRLVRYFARKHCPFPEELADEVLNRVARRLEEEGSISTDEPAHYCYIVARFVFLESTRQNQNHPLKDSKPVDVMAKRDEVDRRSESLEKCLQSLDSEDRSLILDYYRGQKQDRVESRKKLAAKWKLTTNAVFIRVCRIRRKLEECVQKSMERKK